MHISTTFSNGSLAGFHVSAPSLVQLEQTYKGSRGKLFNPITGGCFVRVDDPRQVDSNNLREPSADLAAEDLIQVCWLPRDHGDGTETHGGKSAWIEYRDVVIPRDERLWFRCAFLRFGGLPTNAFAALLAYPNNDTKKDPLPPYWISDVKDLVKNHVSANQTDWTEHFVKIDPHADFMGTVRWIVGTGHNISKDGIPNNTRYASPGCLLIDAIDVR